MSVLVNKPVPGNVLGMAALPSPQSKCQRSRWHGVGPGRLAPLQTDLDMAQEATWARDYSQ